MSDADRLDDILNASCDHVSVHVVIAEFLTAGHNVMSMVMVWKGLLALFAISKLRGLDERIMLVDHVIDRKEIFSIEEPGPCMSVTRLPAADVRVHIPAVPPFRWQVRPACLVLFSFVTSEPAGTSSSSTIGVYSGPLLTKSRILSAATTNSADPMIEVDGSEFLCLVQVQVAAVVVGKQQIGSKLR